MPDAWWRTLSLYNEADNLCEKLLAKIDVLARTWKPGAEGHDQEAMRLYRLLRRAWWRKKRRWVNHSLASGKRW